MTKEEFMKPGEVCEVTVGLSSTAHTFLAGHRVRIIVSSSNFPRFAVNPNDGGHFLEKDRKGLIATNSIYHDTTHKSLLILPVAETKENKAQEKTNNP
jgi:putative CocE/NonD family hydrolase